MISLVTEGVSLNVCDPECEDVLDREGLSVLLTVIELDKDEMIEILRDSETLRVTGSAGVLVEDGVPGEMDIVKVSECENVPVTEELLLYESLSVIVRVCDSSCVVDDEKECVDVRLDDLDSDGEAERLCDSEKDPVAVFDTSCDEELDSDEDKVDVAVEVISSVLENDSVGVPRVKDELVEGVLLALVDADSDEVGVVESVRTILGEVEYVSVSVFDVECEIVQESETDDDKVKVCVNELEI